MLTEPINTRLADLSRKITYGRGKPATFSFNDKKYTTGNSGRYATIRELAHDFGKILSDQINTIDLPGGQVCHGDGIRFNREEQHRIAVSSYDKAQEIPGRDKKQDFMHALISYYARKCGIDFEDGKVHDLVKVCVRDEISGFLSSITLFHRFVGSTCSGSGTMYTDLRATLFDEVEFEKFREFKNAHGTGLIEKFFNGLHEKLVGSKSTEVVPRRRASRIHPDLVTSS